MNSMKKISVVMCTYNGGRYLRQQMDTVVEQTYPLYEVIVQDDGSTDNTLDILQEYAAKHPHVKLFKNTDRHGVNGNFFSAMRRATGDYIAICDQDDIWELHKIERMVATIGDSLMCSCRTKPFSEDGSPAGYDNRMPNYQLPRLLFASILGHSMLFRRELLDKLPDVSNTYFDTVYDVILGVTAAACGRVTVCNEILVHQRRYASATTVSAYDFDKRRTPSIGNGLYILWWSVCHFSNVRPRLQSVFQQRKAMLEAIKGADSEAYLDAIRICQLEGQPGLISVVRLSRLFVKHRHHLFYAEGKGLVNLARALLYPVMQLYDYRYLLPHTEPKK